MIDYVWILPALMALVALINGLGCRKLGTTAGWLATGAMALTFVFSVILFFEVQGHVKDAKERAAETAGLTESAVLEQLFVPATTATASAAATTVRDGLGGYVPLWNWFTINGVFGGDRTLNVDFAFHVDQLTVIFLLFISFVGTLVFFYATGYLREHHGDKLVPEAGFARFFSYLALFAASMYILILGANLPVLFIGWEGVGLCSYLLIGYYYDRQFREGLSCAEAGTKAFVVNRIGDLGILLGMFLLFWGTGTLDIQSIIAALISGDASAGFAYAGGILTAATILLFIGATGKSAQIPLFTWLPDAMAGPTPVSALIHAATMVTAGIYLLARFNPAFMMTPDTMLLIAIIGGATAFVAAFAALTQRRLKSILAYSTVSQLGFMFLAMGVGAFGVGIFHVFTHAFFKAGLFLAAGSVIFALHHEEDIFKMGGLRKKLPKTWLTYLACTLAIAGVFPFAGFFSKDEILYMTFLAGRGGETIYTLLYILALVTAAMTAFYMARSLFLVFHGNQRVDAAAEEHHDHDDEHHHPVTFDKVHESPASMTSVLLVLAFCALVVGFFNVPKGLIPLGSNNEVFHHFLEPVTDRGALEVAKARGYAGDHAPYGPIIVADMVDEDGARVFALKELTILGSIPAEKGLAIISLLIALSGIGLAWALYGKEDGLTNEKKLENGTLTGPLYAISKRAWGWDQFYEVIFAKGGRSLYNALQDFDRVVVDGIIVQGSAGLCRRAGVHLRALQNGQVQVYGVVMVLGACLFLLYFALMLGNVLTTKSKELSSAPAAIQTKSITEAQTTSSLSLIDSEAEAL